jgi:hypothetical protein
MKSKTPIFFYFLGCLLLLISCKSGGQEENPEKSLKKVIGKRIEMPVDITPFDLSDSISYEDYFRSKYKVIYFVDSTECNECCVRYMSLFKKFLEQSNRISSPLLIIFNTNDLFDIQIFMRKYDMKFPYFLDKNSSLKNKNKYLKDGSFNIFLSRNDTIIFAGSEYNEDFCNAFLEQIGK